MGKARVVSAIAGVAMTAALVGSSTASAATLIGDYQLQGTRASSGPGPTLLDVGGVNSFQTDSVFGTSRQVLRFPLHSGVQMFPAGIGGSTAPYSAVTTFKFDTVNGNYARILDPTPGQTIDRGIYELGGKVQIYPDGANVDSPQIVFAPNTYATVAVTSAPPTQLKVFVNGALVAQAAQANQTIPVVSDTLRFFKDNDSATTNEDSAGAVSCIRVFSGLLSDSEVGAIGASPNCTPPPSAPPSTPAAKKKRCKKHKKKHRSAESAKKKKCKNKKKR